MFNHKYASPYYCALSSVSEMVHGVEENAPYLQVHPSRQQLGGQLRHTTVRHLRRVTLSELRRVLRRFRHRVGAGRHADRRDRLVPDHLLLAGRLRVPLLHAPVSRLPNDHPLRDRLRDLVELAHLAVGAAGLLRLQPEQLETLLVRDPLEGDGSGKRGEHGAGCHLHAAAAHDGRVVLRRPLHILLAAGGRRCRAVTRLARLVLAADGGGAGDLRRPLLHHRQDLAVLQHRLVVDRQQLQRLQDLSWETLD